MRTDIRDHTRAELEEKLVSLGGKTRLADGVWHTAPVIM